MCLHACYLPTHLKLTWSRLRREPDSARGASGCEACHFRRAEAHKECARTATWRRRPAAKGCWWLPGRALRSWRRCGTPCLARRSWGHEVGPGPWEIWASCRGRPGHRSIEWKASVSGRRRRARGWAQRPLEVGTCECVNALEFVSCLVILKNRQCSVVAGCIGTTISNPIAHRGRIML